jgi:hypothetical protein
MHEAFKDTLYAIAIRSGDGLWLLARVRRSQAGDVYFLIPRDEPSWNPHASYHQSGISQVRSYRWKHFITQRQRPDGSFRGVETVFVLAIQPGEAYLHRIACIAKKFNGVFEIPIDHSPQDEHHTLVVDLIEPGIAAAPGPWREIVLQKAFQDAVPWILVTLWRGLTF